VQEDGSYLLVRLTQTFNSIRIVSKRRTLVLVLFFAALLKWDGGCRKRLRHRWNTSGKLSFYWAPRI